MTLGDRNTIDGKSKRVPVIHLQDSFVLEVRSNGECYLRYACFFSFSDDDCGVASGVRNVSLRRKIAI